LRGVSTHLDGSGRVLSQWVKTATDRLDPAQFIEMFKSALEGSGLPTAPATRPPGSSSADILAVYPLGDPHVGMLAWGAEAGEDFDLAIVERNITAAHTQLVDVMHPADECLIIDLGDFFHADNQEARTARSGHALDVDGRLAKTWQVGVRIMVTMVGISLRKHRTVRVIVERGNHDDNGALMLAMMLQVFFRDEPRVIIDTNPGTFHYHRFGANLIGVTHGHNTKAAQLPGVMACDRSKDWGETAHRYWYTGHVHHESRKEYPGCMVETFRTLAARDAYHAGHGYRAGRSVVGDILHRKHGRIQRNEIGIEQICPRGSE
jgi:hypothetical protein